MESVRCFSGVLRSLLFRLGWRGEGDGREGGIIYLRLRGLFISHGIIRDSPIMTTRGSEKRMRGLDLNSGSGNKRYFVIFFDLGFFPHVMGEGGAFIDGVGRREMGEYT